MRSPPTRFTDSARGAQARPAPEARSAARRRSSPVRRRVSALLRPRPRGHSHRAGRANRLTPDMRSRRHIPNTGPHGHTVSVGIVVSMSAVLVTGMSGTGKSSALAELGRRGYRVVDTDDPGWREYRKHVGSSDELHGGGGSGSRRGSPGCWIPRMVARSSCKGA